MPTAARCVCACQLDALTIVTHLSAAESDYFQDARNINQAYADRHDYSFQMVNINHAVAADRDARWSKVKILSKVPETDMEAGGAVLWMDNNAVFMNLNYSVLSLVENMKEHRAKNGSVTVQTFQRSQIKNVDPG